MANKDHSLDDQIISSAISEFLKEGYEKASLRKIASKANVTIGAIYTRYRTKDMLFSSLCSPLIEKITVAFKTIKEEYYKDSEHLSLDNMSSSMQKESDAILHILFDDYELAVLLLCKSAGSSVENFFDKIVDKKTEETVKFFKNAGLNHPCDKVLKLLVNVQFDMYFRIIDSGCKLIEAREMMKKAMIYSQSGWMAVLSEYNK